jgi:hypothetical protein
MRANPARAMNIPQPQASMNENHLKAPAAVRGSQGQPRLERWIGAPESILDPVQQLLLVP